MADNKNMYNQPKQHDPDAVFNQPTTAAEALAHAPTFGAAREVEGNVHREQESAEQAASVAKTLGSRYTGEPSTAVDHPRNQASQKLDEAAKEGKRDVESAKATVGQYTQQAKSTTGEYAQQAKEMAAKATETASSYLSSATGNAGQRAMEGGSNPGSTQGSGIGNTLHGAAKTAVETTATYAASAKQAAQPHIDKAVAAVQNALGTAGTQGAQVKEVPGSSTGIPSTSAPLETGSKKIGTPYPSTTTIVGTKEIAQNDSKTIN